MILGLDPGRDKAGFAVAGDDKALFFSGIFPVEDRGLFWAALRAGVCDVEAFRPWLREARLPPEGEARLCAIALGNGTYSGVLARDARDVERCPFGCRVLDVDERGTTLEARKLYWRLHGPAWWQRFLPGAMRVPPRPVDDLAAWAIAMRAAEMLLSL